MGHLRTWLVSSQPEVIHLNSVSRKDLCESIMAASDTRKLVQAVQLGSLLVGECQTCILVFLTC